MLASRLGARHPGAERARELARLGATVEIVECDVVEAADVVALVDVAARDGDLRTVVHAAGVEGAGPALLSGRDDLRAILAPKVAGATNLAEALAEVPDLDAVLLCSSVGALIEEPRRVAYAAANAFLDGIAHEQRGRGRPWLSVAWGPWAGAGMAEEAEASLRSIGWWPIAPSSGGALAVELASRIASLPPHVVVAPADWSRIRAVTSGTVPDGFLDRLVTAPPAPPEPSLTRPRATDLRAKVLESSSPDSVLVDAVSRTVAAILRSPGTLDPTTGFFDLGLDSLMALELSRELGADLGVELGATLAFSHPTVLELAAHLHEILLADVGIPSSESDPEQQVPTAVDVSGIDDRRVTDPEVDDLLARLEEKFRSHDER